MPRHASSFRPIRCRPNGWDQAQTNICCGRCRRTARCDGTQRARLTLPCARRKARSLHEPDDGLTQRRICRFAVVGESIGWYAPCLSRTGNENNHPPRVAAVASGMFPKPRRGAFDIHNYPTTRPVAALALMWAQTPMPNVVCRWSMKGSQAPRLHTNRALS